MGRTLLRRGLALGQTAPRSAFTCVRYSTTHAAPDWQQPLKTNPRWLSDLKKRAEVVLQHGTASPAAAKVRNTVQQLQTSWLELSAKREGFLAEDRWIGINRQPIAWGDMDSMVRHVNNVVYNKLAETARVNWVTSFAQHCSPEHRQAWRDLLSPRSIGLILRSIKTDYKLPMTYPDRVTVIHKLTAEPTAESDALMVEAAIFSERHQRISARTFEDIVVYDYRTAKRATLQPFMVDELRRVWQLQIQSRQEAEDQIISMEKAVKQAETSL